MLPPKLSKKPNKAFIIGHPVSHSLSPKMHEFWMRELGIDGSYEAFDIPPKYFTKKLLLKLAALGYKGGNITIPHKEKAAILSNVGKNVIAIGAVNTLMFVGGEIRATNTDYAGFLISVLEKNDFKKALVLGAGGAARAIILALKNNGAEVIVANRTAERARKLAEEFGCETLPWEKKEAAILDTDLLINTTSLGMKGQPDLEINLAKIKKSAVVYDIVYNPLETSLLKQARSEGLNTKDGLDMLIYQGMTAFHIWFPGTEVFSNDLIEKTKKYLIKFL